MIKKVKKQLYIAAARAASRIGDRILAPRGPITRACFILCRRCGLFAEI